MVHTKNMHGDRNKKKRKEKEGRKKKTKKRIEKGEKKKRIKKKKREKGKKKERKKKRKRKRVKERKKKKWDIGGVEGCGKVEGKGGSPEASGDGGGRLGQASRKSSSSFLWKQQATGKSCSSYFCVLQNPFSSFWHFSIL